VSRNVIATAAFCVINTGWTCAPGAVFPASSRCSGLTARWLVALVVRQRRH
jgi:hypothetical protein